MTNASIKENSPDIIKGAMNNIIKKMEDLKTEHRNKKEDLDKLNIFEKFKFW